MLHIYNPSPLALPSTGAMKTLTKQDLRYEYLFILNIKAFYYYLFIWTFLLLSIDFASYNPKAYLLNEIKVYQLDIS